MAAVIGGTDISDILEMYLGEDNISAIYLGEDLVWEGLLVLESIMEVVYLPSEADL